MKKSERTMDMKIQYVGKSLSKDKEHNFYCFLSEAKM